MRQVDTFDASGKLDSRWIEYDKTSKHVYAVFVDWDQANQHNWASKTTYVGNTRNAVFDYTVLVNDDKSKTIIDYDTAPSAYDWSEKTTHYTAAGKIDWQTGIFDDGRRWSIDWDEANVVRWKFYQDIYDSNGNVETTTFTYDDDSVEVVDWKHVHGQDGTSSGETLTGTSGRDFLRGFGGNDVLISGGGSDRLEGGVGNDIYYVSSMEDLVIENPNQGIDTVRSDGSYTLAPNFENLILLSGTYGTGNMENNFIAGNDAPNILSGLSGNDHLSGAGGNDILVGGPGNDVLEGGPGADILSGNAGADVFIWRNLSDLGQFTATADLVKDFSHRDGDLLNLAQIDANANAPGNQAFTFIGQATFTHPGQISYIHSGGETRILLNTDSDKDAEAVIRLPGLKIPDASWFVL
nr:calcium-binding protein [Microvirga puerhi]